MVTEYEYFIEQVKQFRQYEKQFLDAISRLKHDPVFKLLFPKVWEKLIKNVEDYPKPKLGTIIDGGMGDALYSDKDCVNKLLNFYPRLEWEIDKKVAWERNDTQGLVSIISQLARLIIEIEKYQKKFSR